MKVVWTLAAMFAGDQLDELGLLEGLESLVESIRLFKLGFWNWPTPMINFFVGTSGVVFLLFLFDVIFRVLNRILNFFLDFSSKRLSIVHSALYCLWSVCLMLSPLINVSLTHLMCLLWLVRTKRPYRTDPSVKDPSLEDPTRLDSILILQRLFHFALNLPSLVVLVRNVVETDFSLVYIDAQLSQNINTEHTCLGILMWIVLHFDQIRKLLVTSDAFRIGIFCSSSFLVLTIENSFYKCTLFDLSVWVMAGCLTIFDKCFHVEKTKKD